MKQSVNGKLWSTYVIPRLLYGLGELKQSDIDQLEQYERKSLKQMQHLPDRTHSSASLALLGIPPVECVLHKTMLGLFWRWITSKGVEKETSLRKLAMNMPTESSWFNRIHVILNRYGLPSPSELMDDPPPRPPSPMWLKWKSAVDNARKVEENWREDIQGRPTLKYINSVRIRMGQVHPVWATVRDSVFDSRRA